LRPGYEFLPSFSQGRAGGSKDIIDPPLAMWRPEDEKKKKGEKDSGRKKKKTKGGIHMPILRMKKKVVSLYPCVPMPLGIMSKLPVKLISTIGMTKMILIIMSKSSSLMFLKMLNVPWSLSRYKTPIEVNLSSSRRDFRCITGNLTGLG
jgi:hypothetical protein